MGFKIGYIIIPLVLSSIVEKPSFDMGNYTDARSWLSIINSDLSFPDESVSWIFPSISLPSSSSSSLSSSSSSEVVPQDYFSCPRYGPFSLTSPSNFDATFEYELNTISSQSIRERIRLFDHNNSVLASSYKTSFAYTVGTRKSVTFTIPIADYWSVNGLTLNFEIVNSSSYTILKAFSATFYPPSKKTLSGAALKRETYITKPLGFYGDGEGLKPIIETFDFTTIGDYVDVDYYYRLSLTNNYFIHSRDCSLTYYSAKLRFNDDENLFPYFTHQDNENIILPLTLYKNNRGETTFRFKNMFYINKNTLQISDTYHNEFVLTNDFYLPINGKEKFNNKQLYIDLERMGLDGITTSIPIKYDVNQSLVGVCTDGEYCVVGGAR